ncbi:ABC transporter permease [Rhodobacteraceae bacterium]|nr:ABC transporter permease [Paracoccaceae bacterium]
MGRLFPWVLGAMIVLFLAMPQLFAPLLRPFASNPDQVIYDRASLMALTSAHLLLVAMGIVPAALLAIVMAAFVSRPGGADFLPLSRVIVNIGQTVPPVAVLALTVPMLGFGTWPTVCALFLYGLLPIFENALAGFSTLPQSVVTSARAMGMTSAQIFWRVELPLAAPLVLDGLRLALVIALSTATIGSTVAARSLGEVIIAGLTVNNQAYLLQGGVLTAALALVLHAALQGLTNRMRRKTGRPLA